MLVGFGLLFACFVVLFRHLVDFENSLSALLKSAAEVNRKLSMPVALNVRAQDAPRPRGRPVGSTKRAEAPQGPELPAQDPRQVHIDDATKPAGQ
jgi:hypothetical protein